MKHKVVIGLGSNIEPDKNIQKARRLVGERYQVLSESDFVQTKPIGLTDQNDFINGAMYIETNLEPNQLNKELKGLEQVLGRKKSDIKFGPRTIDLDIIVYDNQIMDEDFYDRDFLKKSVLQLIPNLQY